MFTNVMTWLILLMLSISILFLGLYAFHLQRPRALLGVGGMASIVIGTSVSLLLLDIHAEGALSTWSQLLLPLVAPLLVASLYALTFEPADRSYPWPARRRHFLLLLLTSLASGCTVTLVLLDLSSP
jgi:hypothetical protein